MSIQLHDETDKVVDIELEGKLTGQEYDRAAPKLEQIIQERGQVRMVCEMHDFHGWSPRALWKDARFGIQHRNDVDRLAIVTEKPWQRAIGRMYGWIASGQVRCFSRDEADEARIWVRAPSDVPSCGF